MGSSARPGLTSLWTYRGESCFGHSLTHKHWRGGYSNSLNRSHKYTVAFGQVISDFKPQSWGPLGTQLWIRLWQSGFGIWHIAASSLWICFSGKYVKEGRVEIKIGRTVFFFLNFYWRIVDLKCCANLLYCKVTQLYTYRHSFFIFFSITVYHRRLTLVPCAVE